MHDFGGPVGMGLVIRHRDRIMRIVSVDGPVGQPDLIERIANNVAVAPWFQWVPKADKEGVTQQVLGQFDSNILWTLKRNGCGRNEIMGDTRPWAYRAPFRRLRMPQAQSAAPRGSPPGPHPSEDSNSAFAAVRLTYGFV